jgi:hypothetical protein
MAEINSSVQHQNSSNALRKQLFRNGFSPLPAKGKKPPKRWSCKKDPSQQIQITEATIDEWDSKYVSFPNTCLRCDETLAVVDVDVLDEDLVKKVCHDAATRLELKQSDKKPLTRQGCAPKLAFLCRVEGKSFGKLWTHRFRRTGKPDVTARVEILAHGQQTVAFGTHPDTGRPYVWLGSRSPDNTPLAELVPITARKAVELINAFEAILAQEPGWELDKTSTANLNFESKRPSSRTANVNFEPKRGQPSNFTGESISEDDKRKVEHALQQLVELAPHLATDYETWLKGCMALKSACDDEWAFPWFDWWSSSADNYDPTAVADKWHSVTPDGGITIATIIHWAQKAWHERVTASTDCLSVDENEGTSSSSSADGSSQGAAQPKKFRFNLERADQIEISNRRSQLVKGILPRTGLAVIWGAEKSLKTTWLIDLLMHVATGRGYRDRKTEQGVVIYVILEGGEGFRTRIRAWRGYYLPAADHSVIPFHVVSCSLSLARDHKQLVKEIEAQLPEGVKPAVVVVDTLARSIEGSESSDEAMKGFIDGADFIRDRFNCLAAIVHHCGHEGGRPRGHSSLLGAYDVLIRVQRSNRDVVTATVQQMKDGEEGAEIVSLKEVIEVGTDEDGHAITAVVAVPTAGPVLTPHEKHLIAVAREIQIERGDIFGDQPISVRDWNERAFAMWPASLHKIPEGSLANCRTNLKRLKVIKSATTKRGEWIVPQRGFSS